MPGAQSQGRAASMQPLGTSKNKKGHYLNTPPLWEISRAQHCQAKCYSWAMKNMRLEDFLAEYAKGRRAFNGVNLDYAKLFGASLRGVDLCSADLLKADLRAADLRGARFWKAELLGADFSGADLRGVDFWGANLNGAKLDGAILDGAKFEGAIGVDLP